MSVENVENHMAHTCKCGSVNFALLKSGAIECNKCSDVMSEAKWLSAQPVEEHSLSLSYQIRRAIKAEDALRTAKQEVANLNELLNASYVDPTGKSGLSALLKKVFWPSKLDKEILELVASQAIELEELGKEVTCIPDMREEIVYLKAQIAAKQAQPERAPLYSLDTDSENIRARTVHAVLGAVALGANNENKPPSGHWLAEIWDIARAEREGAVDRVTTLFENCETPYLPDIARAIDGAAHGIKQAQPERAPLSDEQKCILFGSVEQVKDGNELDYYLLGFEAAEQAHGIKQGGQHD